MRGQAAGWMPTEVKICGLRDEASFDAALDAGADYVGFVFYPRSPRDVSSAVARGLAERARGRAKIVTLLVDPDDDLLADVIAAVEPDIVQLHGAETPERVDEIVQRFSRPVMKAVAVATAADVEAALAYTGVVERILFDAKPLPSEGGALPGGNGVPFDWQALASVNGRIDYMLAGGLTADNVAEAVRLTGARAVDVSSGVERRPGEKDPELIARFIRAAKTAKQTP
jgi:phosphoribosylanthranilate isomerase